MDRLDELEKETEGLLYHTVRRNLPLREAIFQKVSIDYYNEIFINLYPEVGYSVLDIKILYDRGSIEMRLYEVNYLKDKYEKEILEFQERIRKLQREMQTCKNELKELNEMKGK